MLSLSSIGTVILCLGFSVLGAQQALDCIETKNKQVNKTKGERQTKRVGGMGQTGFSICLEPSAFGLLNESTHRRLPTHTAYETLEEKKTSRLFQYSGDTIYTTAQHASDLFS